MAATVTSPWGKPGAWALDSEEHEDELNKQQQESPTPTYAKSTTTAAMSDFPDLMTAAATKTKKKKSQTVSLSEFVTGKPNNSYQANKGLTAEDMLNLPTGPRQRSAEEMDRARSNGFRSYDRSDSSGRWGPGRGNDEDGGRRGPVREPLGPSRADETDDWAAAKKPGGGGFSRRDGGGFFDGERGSGTHSRADEVDSWASNKKAVEIRRGNGGGGFDRGERRTGFESTGAADSAETWGRKKDVEVSRGGGSGSAFDSLRDRRGGIDASDSDTWGRKREEVSSGGGGLSRPKLNLQPRKLPVGEVETVKPSKGSNPFGDARPREEVLKEKGEDWKEIDEKLEATKIKDLGSGDRFIRGGKPRSNEDSAERSWRKNQAEAADVPPSRMWMMPEHKCYWSVLSPNLTVALVFGPLASTKYGTNITLLQSMYGRSEPYRTLLREGTTALLNSYTSNQFVYRPQDIVQRLNSALEGNSTLQALTMAYRFIKANSGQTGNTTCKFSTCA